MARGIFASIITRSEEIRKNVPVDEITPVGILINDSAADETLDILIPWHRVWEVYCRSEGVLTFETRT